MSTQNSDRQYETRLEAINFLAIWIAVTAVFLLLLFAPRPEAGSLLAEFRDVGVEVTATASLFSLIFTYITRKDFKREISRALTVLFSENPVFLHRLSDTAQKDIVKKTLQAILSERYGTIVYDQIVKFYLDEKDPYRPHYRYTIDCLKEPDEILSKSEAVQEVYSKIQENDEGFLWMQQVTEIIQCSYKKIDARDFPRKLSVAFCFDTTVYNSLRVERRRVLRELLRLPEDLIELLRSYKSSEQLRDIILGLFDFQMIGQPDTAHNIDVRWQSFKNMKQAYFEIIFDNLAKEGEEDENGWVEYNINIGFTIPHVRRNTNFSVSLPLPTNSPQIEFSREAGTIKNLEPVTYLSQFGISQELSSVDDEFGPRRWRYRTHHWIFPMSGIMFVWEDNEGYE